MTMANDPTATWIDDDMFECDECHRVLDIDDSVKPAGKKGPMLCGACSSRFVHPRDVTMQPFTITPKDAGHEINLTIHAVDYDLIERALAQYAQTLLAEMLASDPTTDEYRQIMTEHRDTRQFLGRLEAISSALWIVRDRIPDASGETAPDAVEGEF